jgi:hypothetical protein
MMMEHRVTFVSVPRERLFRSPAVAVAVGVALVFGLGVGLGIGIGVGVGVGVGLRHAVAGGVC